MENKRQKTSLPWIIVGVVIVAFVFYVIGSKQSAPNESPNVPVTENTTDVATGENQLAPVSAPQQKVVVPQAVNVNYDLSENPSYLFSKLFNPYKAKVFGAGVGDSVSKLDQASIIQETEYGGWIHTTNGTGYRIVNGAIEEIALNKDGIANLISDNEIIIKFGQPDRTTNGGTPPYGWTTYYYISRGLVVTDYQTSGIDVNIIGN